MKSIYLAGKTEQPPVDITEENATTSHYNGLSVLEKNACNAESLSDIAHVIDDIALMSTHLLFHLRTATQRVLYQNESVAFLRDVEGLLERDAMRPGRIDHGLAALLAAHELLSGVGRPLLVAAEQVRSVASSEEKPVESHGTVTQ